MSPRPQSRPTLEEYLAFERRAEARNEYFQGEIFAMAGASREHNLIVAEIVAALVARLRSRDCLVFPSDMKVRIEKVDKVTYPDVTVVCGEERYDDEQRDVLLNPTMIVEVLSDSTEAYDRGAKFEHYQALESLTEYILISQSSCRAEQFIRQNDNTWTYRELHSPDDVLHSASTGCEISLADLYRRLPGILDTARRT